MAALIIRGGARVLAKTAQRVLAFVDSGSTPTFGSLPTLRVKLAEISESKHAKMCFNQINSGAAAMKPEREIDLERLPQLPSSELVKIVVQQQLVIEQLKQEVARLKASLQKDSTTSSKPPSTDLLKKPEKPKNDAKDKSQPKRKPGGQPGHQGKTRKGFKRVDRYEILKPQQCIDCGSVEFVETPFCHTEATSSPIGRASDRGSRIPATQLYLCQVWSNPNGWLAQRYYARSRLECETASLSGMVRELWSSVL